MLYCIIFPNVPAITLDISAITTGVLPSQTLILNIK